MQQNGFRSAYVVVRPQRWSSADANENKNSNITNKTASKNGILMTSMERGGVLTQFPTQYNKKKGRT
jgi:hypothetical protein